MPYIGNQRQISRSDGYSKSQSDDKFLDKSGDTVLNIRETEQNVTGGAADANAGAIINMTLTANAVLDITNLSPGQYVTLHITGGDTYSMDWATNHTISWHGGVPVLGSVHTVTLEQTSMTLYGYDAQEVL